ncbi:MAG: 2-oxoacid:acceptor oxidoreductase family protein [Candidatus Methanomethylicaceae archaeon]|jgi:pyruvate ferredoxin oxidoreductase gamma subunit
MFVELRLHGRGGQGIVTASEMLVEAATIDGYYGQSIPIFGAERRGAPVTASARISDQPIRRHSQIYNPDIVAVFDPLFLLRGEVTAGLKDSGEIVVNHRTQPDIKKYKVHIVDATRIAMENGLVVAGWAVVNTAMLGAIAKVLGTISKGALEKVVRMRWSGDLGDRNIRAALQAFGEVV